MLNYLQNYQNDVVYTWELVNLDRILGIDHGDSRTGLAVSDLMGWTAQGIETVHHKGNIKILLNKGKI